MPKWSVSEITQGFVQTLPHASCQESDLFPSLELFLKRTTKSTPAGLRPPGHCGVAAWPLVSEQQRLPRKVFRRSIAWLSDSLSTLRSTGYPRPTQESLLRLRRIGQTLLDGLVTHRVPLKGF